MQVVNFITNQRAKTAVFTSFRKFRRHLSVDFATNALMYQCVFHFLHLKCKKVPIEPDLKIHFVGLYPGISAFHSFTVCIRRPKLKATS